MGPVIDVLTFINWVKEISEYLMESYIFKGILLIAFSVYMHPLLIDLVSRPLVRE